jgi:hypothetical protein
VDAVPDDLDFRVHDRVALEDFADDTLTGMPAVVASRPGFFPSRRNAFPSFTPLSASASDGAFTSGGVIACR